MRRPGKPGNGAEKAPERIVGAMLNNDKIRLMNEIALFEKKERKRERPAEVFFRGDYVAKHMLQSFFAWTLSYGLVLAVVLLYILERILNTVDVMEVVKYARTGVLIYLAGLFIFEVITVIVYRRRYAAAVGKRETHYTKLNRLRKRYEIHDRIRELGKEGGRNA